MAAANSVFKLKVETSEYDQKLANAAKGIRHLADVAHKADGDLTGLKKSELDYIRALGEMETKSRSASGQLRELSSTYKEMKVVYDQLNEVEKADEGGKALAASLATLKQRAQDAKAQLDTATLSLNDNGEAGKGTSSVMEMLKDKFTVNIDAVKLFNIGLQAAEAALNVAKDAFFQSESNIDEWGRTVEGAKGAYNVFLDTLNNGNWSNFFQNLQTAIQGGRDLYDVFDRLGSIKSNNAAAIALTQKEIAELRLAKQQGENVDAKLKSATERLAALQKQGVSAGMTAGSQSAFQTIRNGVNSVGGASINDATIKYAVDLIMKNGQSEFDKYARNRDILRERGMVTKTQTINDSQGGTYERQYREFDINALTKEQQKQYALAQAITEGETRIQAGISAYAQAVIEGTSSAREAFKGNRYALQGSGGGGARSGGLGSVTHLSIEDILRSSLLKADRGIDADSLRDTSTGPSKLWEMMQQEHYANLKPEQRMSRADFEEGRNRAKLEIENREGDKRDDPLKEAKKQNQYLEGIGSDISGVLSGLEKMGIEIPEGLSSVVGGIQMISGIVSSILTLVGVISALTSVKSVPIIGWALANGGIAGGLGGRRLIHAAGGTVVGNTYSGDQIPAMLNAGEVVLSKAQAGVIASDLQGGGMQNMNLQAVVTGEQLRFILNANSLRRGKGEYVTSIHQ